ncbi:hypothetical protein IEQ34_009685 [Dendrobium chrysotoxum]|uniref:RING-type domain-containing protein n=1 Tax=Dendrobium chrysotoxum TaxID=161865 RepID=A0AAV7H3I9_DENCH|nr:hypothetical protein IEQ34_009685 [Dendrobium chrysotoxum]
MEKDNQPSHVKTIKEIMDEECEKGEEVTWRPFKENLRLRCVKTRTPTMAKDGIGHTRPDSPLSWNMPVRFGRRDDEHGKKVTRMIQERSPPAKEKPVKMSLMALLADEEEEEEDDDDCYKGKRNEHDCCKFMVQHQDAVAIPCGHTFCHLYPRELWASHENCPHCSSFIMEILDVL